jgi:hypothetical protein
MYLPRYLPRSLYLVTPFDDGVVALLKHEGGGARLDKWAVVGSGRQELHRADWVGGASRGRPLARGSLDARAPFCDAAMRHGVRVWSR